MKTTNEEKILKPVAEDRKPLGPEQNEELDDQPLNDEDEFDELEEEEEEEFEDEEEEDDM